MVKVSTSEPELYGLGCATFTQRIRTVQTAVDVYLKQFLVGKSPWDIEDIWQSSFVSSYWRNGPVLNNALGGVDAALWDILGKWTGLPVYQLLGGKSRQHVDTYRSAGGRTFEELVDSFQQLREQGYRHIRCEPVVPEASPPLGPKNAARPANQRTRIWEAAPFARALPRFFGKLRERFGEQVELLTDVHELLPPFWPSSWPRSWNPSACSSWKIRSPRKTSDTSSICASRAAPPSPWASCSTTPTNGWTSSASG